MVLSKYVRNTTFKGPHNVREHNNNIFMLIKNFPTAGIRQEFP